MEAGDLTRSRGRSSEAEPKMEIARRRRRSNLVFALTGRGGDRWADELGLLLLQGILLLGTLPLLGSSTSLDRCCWMISDEFGLLLLLGSPTISDDLATCEHAELEGEGRRARR